MDKLKQILIIINLKTIIVTLFDQIGEDDIVINAQKFVARLDLE